MGLYFSYGNHFNKLLEASRKCTYKYVNVIEFPCNEFILNVCRYIAIFWVKILNFSFTDNSSSQFILRTSLHSIS